MHTPQWCGDPLRGPYRTFRWSLADLQAFVGLVEHVSGKNPRPFCGLLALYLPQGLIAAADINEAGKVGEIAAWLGSSKGCRKTSNTLRLSNALGKTGLDRRC